MRRFIKDDVLSAVAGIETLTAIGIRDKNHKSYKKIELGFSTENAFKAFVQQLKKVLLLAISIS